MNEDSFFSVIRESMFFRPRETGFPFFFVMLETCIILHVICEPATFAGINFHFFGDVSVIKARKLHQTLPIRRARGWRTEN